MNIIGVMVAHHTTTDVGSCGILIQTFPIRVIVSMSFMMELIGKEDRKPK
jgi:hypothetical protein